MKPLNITLECLDIIPKYEIETVIDEHGKHRICKIYQVFAISRNEHAKISDNVDILPLLCNDEIIEIENQILEKYE